VPRNKRATLREVAEATGLSLAAVSYALRGLQVSDETKERVRRAAADLGYEANPIARALAGGQTGLVGVLCGSLEGGLVACRKADPGFARLALHSAPTALDVRIHLRIRLADSSIPVAGGGKWSRVERSGRPSRHCRPE
jgi:transcriptional regulator with XRE-family HTH domain